MQEAAVDCEENDGGEISGVERMEAEETGRVGRELCFGAPTGSADGAGGLGCAPGCIYCLGIGSIRRATAVAAVAAAAAEAVATEAAASGSRQQATCNRQHAAISRQ